MEEVKKLVSDLYFDYDRLSSSGQETLDKIAKLLKIENICKECLGTGKKEIKFIDPITNEYKKSIYMECNCKEVA